MHPSVQRVAAALEERGAKAEVRQLEDSTRTAQEAADALGVPVGAIVKSLVFVADGEPLLVLASGDHQVDVSKVATAVGKNKVKRADADAVRQATGFAIGGVPPVGHATQLRTIVDVHLKTFDELWAAAGTPHAVFRTTYDELTQLTDGEELELASDR